ncbi:MAG: hypothetical protein F6K41_05690 [Symploca sp. SIO3E6]|nr:hypothetical protein [Caldora sp. SIO3E6]
MPLHFNISLCFIYRRTTSPLFIIIYQFSHPSSTSPNSQFPILHSPFSIPNSQFPIPHSPFPYLQFKLGVGDRNYGICCFV